MSDDGVYQVVPARCGVAVLQWRAAAAWTIDTSAAVSQRCAGLMLDDVLSVTPAFGPEIAQELRRAAELLETTIEAVQFVRFDVTSSELVGVLSTLSRLLRASLNDSTGVRLVDLVDPAPHRPHDTAHFADVPLFGPDGPLMSDVIQGSLGDCWLVAALASVADADPSRLASLIVDNRDGTYTVNLDGTAITVDDEFPVGSNGVPVYARGPAHNVPQALWPLVLEKALAQHFGGGYSDLVRDDAERAIDVFGDGDGMSIQRDWRADTSPADVVEQIDAALDAGMPVVATSGEDFGMGAAHAWSVVATGVGTSGAATVTVRNPWGVTGFESDGETVRRVGDGERLEGVDADSVQIDERAAEVTIPVSVFVDEFRELDYLEVWDPAQQPAAQNLDTQEAA